LANNNYLLVKNSVLNLPSGNKLTGHMFRIIYNH